MTTKPEYKRWWRKTWAIWVVVTAASFAVLETIGLVRRQTGDTLSEATRHWLGIERGKALKGGAYAFAAALIAFVAWFIPHILFQVW